MTSPDGPPLCDPSNRNLQVRGKAYPTIRELRVAKGLGAQATVSSLCHKGGYVPAMHSFVDHMSGELGGGCLPLPLIDGTPRCEMVAVFPAGTDQATACDVPGLSQPVASLLSAVDANCTSCPAACVVSLVTDCTTSASGWCYTSAGGCGKIDVAGQPPGSTLHLFCATGTVY